MGCRNMPDINTPLLCPTCEEEPRYTEWEGKYKPKICQLACVKCQNVVRGCSKQKAVDRWNLFVLSKAFSKATEIDFDYEAED